MLSLRVSTFIALSLVSTSSAALEQSWQFESSTNGITIHTREHKQGLVEIRARMFTPTTYSAFLALLEDSNNIPNWIDNASHSRVIKQISATENIVYTQFKAPWPAKDRDMVTYSKFWVDEAGLNIAISDAPASIFAEQSEYLRIHSVKASWTLQKLTNGTTFIEYTAFANPGGALPSWLINRLSKQSARDTFNNLRLQLPKYQAYSHPQIAE